MSRLSLRLQVAESGGELAAASVPLPLPRARWVRVRVEASGVCRADLGTMASPALEVPITPGHEIAGRIDAVGAQVTGWQPGERVAVGWFGGSCGRCRSCRRGDVVHCPDRMIPGVSYPGGWAQHVLVPADALVRIPGSMPSSVAAPLGCAGVTTFNAIRRAGLSAGSAVAVFGIGGLGHLAIQFAAKMGYRVIAMARGAERERMAKDLGAHEYIDTSRADAGQALAAAGGADLLLCTASSTEPVSALLPGLAVGGRLTMIGVDSGSVQVPAADMVLNSWIITGHLTGSPRDIEDTMAFALLHGIEPRIEVVPVENAAEGIERLSQGQVRFRLVIDMETAK